MKPPPAQGTGGGGGKQLDNLGTSNLVFFPSTRKPISPDDATALIRAIAFHLHVDHLHRLGPRAIAEFLAEVGERHLCRTWIEDRLADYARIDPRTLATLGGWRR